MFYSILYLQYLDFATTILGFHLGLVEANPTIIAHMKLTNPILGVCIAKGIGVTIIWIALRTKRTWVMKMIYYHTLALVLWNMALITLVITKQM